MTPKTRVIRSLWWAYPIRFMVTVGSAVLPMVIVHALWTSPKWPSPIGALLVFLLASLFSLGALLSLNLMRFRLEVSGDGFRAIGLLWTKYYRWTEIIRMWPQPNYRVPGHHVGFTVDGSNNVQRPITSLGFKSHYLPPLMEMGGQDLCAYLNRRRREWLRRAGQSSPTSLEGTP